MQDHYHQMTQELPKVSAECWQDYDLTGATRARMDIPGTKSDKLNLTFALKMASDDGWLMPNE